MRQVKMAVLGVVVSGLVSGVLGSGASAAALHRAPKPKIYEGCDHADEVDDACSARSPLKLYLYTRTKSFEYRAGICERHEAECTKGTYTKDLRRSKA
jgi:hypothetical protein